MALQIRRGLESERTAVTPAAGELLYTTDQKRVYVGDGATAGGNLLSGGGGGLNNIVEDTSPQLGGNLDVNGRTIISTGGTDININPSLGGNVILHGNLIVDNLGNISKVGQLNISPTTITTFGSNDTLVDGNMYITRNSYSSTPLQGFTFAQHHNTPDAVNFAFYRSRGTNNSPTAVVNGDDLGDITFVGFDGTGTAGGATISATVEGSPVTGRIPTKFSFFTNNGVNQVIRAELSSAGVWKVNSLQNLNGSDLTLTATTVKVAGDVQINAQGDLRFADSDSSNYVGFQAPATVASNVVWTLPAADGNNGQVLTTNGSGTLNWSTTSGAGLASRTTLAPVTSSILNNGDYEYLEITCYKGYVLYKIQTSDAARVRIYTSEAARLADVLRPEGVNPAAGAGVVADIVSTGAETILITPGAIGFSTETVPTAIMHFTITNKSGATAAITVTFTVLQLEA